MGLAKRIRVAADVVAAVHWQLIDNTVPYPGSGICSSTDRWQFVHS